MDYMDISDYRQAKERVEADTELAEYADMLIHTDWDNEWEHYKWVATAPKDELLSWARAVAKGLYRSDEQQ